MHSLALTCNALTGDGLDELWETVRAHRHLLIETGKLVDLCKRQRVRWLQAMVDQAVLDSFRRSNALKPLVATVETDVRSQKVTVVKAALMLLDAWREDRT